MSINGVKAKGIFLLNKLQNFIFSNAAVCGDPDLFFHVHKGTAAAGPLSSMLHINEHSVVDFDSYFNCFAAGKWKGLCSVRQVAFVGTLQGQAVLSLYCFSERSGRILIEQKSIYAEEPHRCRVLFDTGNLSDDSLVYVEICTGAGKALLQDAFFATSEPKKRPVNIAVIMTTFRREQFVGRNIEALKAGFLEREEGMGSSLIIIDNGKTLKRMNTSQVRIIHNKNSGGAGGFARGMLTALEEPGRFSHISLADDDIVIEPEAYRRLVCLFRMLDDPDTCIGGAMFRTDPAYVQHENGAVLSKTYSFKPVHHGFDLRDGGMVFANEEDAKRDYWAWWCFSMPVGHIQRFGLPIPAFIRCDDVEYGLRLKNAGIRTTGLNGIAVWHEPFERRYSSILCYYEERNNLLVRAVHDERFSYLDFIARVVYRVVGHAFTYRYESSEMCLAGYEHSLKGPLFFLECNADMLHRSLTAGLKEQAVAFDKEELATMPDRGSEAGIRFLKILLAALTLNGHLLPGFLLNEKGVSVYRRFGDYMTCLGRKKVCYMAPGSNFGFRGEQDKNRFFKIIFRMCQLIFTSYPQFIRAKRDYRRSITELTGRAYWRNSLGL